MVRKEFLNGVIAALLFLALAAAPPVQAKTSADKSGNQQKLSKVETSNVYKPMDINNIFNYYSNNGDGSFNKFLSSNEGFEFPIGSNDGTAIFEDGLVWTAYKNGTLYSGGSTYNHGLQPGKIVSNGTSTTLPTADNPDLAKYRVYRVRPDMKPISGVTDPDDPAAATELGALTSEVTYTNRFENYTAEQLLQQYWTDWNEWPASDGAPFTDANGVQHPSGGPGYDPKTCVPGFPGADQTQWMVMNDLNPTLTKGLYGSNPIGLEVQRTIWAYNRKGALGNTIFISYKFVNKSGVALDSMYVSQWADPDLGFAGDDAVGCDTSRSMGFVYNGTARDANFANLGLAPPAVGFDFFQGPVVSSAGDTAIFDMKYVPGKKNLPMTAFDFFINGNVTFQDPPLNNIDGTRQWYNLMRGLVSTTGAPFPADVTGGTTFSYPGDPVTGVGPTYIGPAAVSPPADVRMCLNSGPFSMAPGDTQQVVVAAVVGLGGDNLSSITVLRTYDDNAQSAYNVLFQLAVPPPAPVVHIAALDKQIVLSWGDPTASTKPSTIENFTSKGYSFEGYNVYQYPSNSSVGGKLLATYDLVNDVTTIQDTVFNPTIGAYSVEATEFGKNTGLQHNITITKDALTGGALVNDRDYYFAVTAYSYNPTTGLVPHALENSPVIQKIRPQTPLIGQRFSSSAGDTLDVTHTGISDGKVIVSVTDPAALTGHQYQVGFTVDTGAGSGNTGNTYWKLTDVTANKVLISGQKQAAAGTVPAAVVVDGIAVRTYGPPPGMKDWSVTGTRHWTFVNADWGSEGFSGAIGNAYDQWFSSSTVTYDKLKNVQIKFAITDTAGNFDPNDPNASYGYRYLRGAQSPKAQPWFANIPNPGASFNYQDYTKSVPLAAYDIEANPPRRLMVGYSENNVTNGLADGKYWPPFYNDATYGDNIGTSGPREWLFIFDKTYSETPDPTLEQNILNNTLPIMWFCTVTRRDDGAWTGTTSPSWTFTILANHINLTTDQFTFTTTAATQTKANQIADVSKINVFPNPYFGFNKLETDKYTRFVRFTHLPQKATIRIYNLAGILVRTLQKNDATQFKDWDLLNESQLPIAAGMYIAYIDLPDLGQTKTLKLAIIPEQQFLDHY